FESRGSCATSEACTRGKVLCCYIYEPSLIQSPEWDASHGSFLNESLQELEDSLKRTHLRLYRFQGEVIEVLNRLREVVEIETLWSHEETGNGLTYERDKRVKKWCLEQGIPWKQFPQFGVVRRLSSREGWARQWNAFMSQPAVSLPRQIKSFSNSLSFETSPYVFPQDTKSYRKKGGIKRPQKLLKLFCKSGDDFTARNVLSQYGLGKLQSVKPLFEFWKYFNPTSMAGGGTAASGGVYRIRMARIPGGIFLSASLALPLYSKT
ncbi:hypothetical protein EBQ90_12795, partial [bacterium]|nr:hypothetical protein [bacterium]